MTTAEMTTILHKLFIGKFNNLLFICHAIPNRFQYGSIFKLEIKTRFLYFISSILIFYFLFEMQLRNLHVKTYFLNYLQLCSFVYWHWNKSHQINTIHLNVIYVILMRRR